MQIRRTSLAIATLLASLSVTAQAQTPSDHPAITACRAGEASRDQVAQAINDAIQAGQFTLADLQTWMTASGHYMGRIGGMPGPATQFALNNWIDDGCP